MREKEKGKGINNRHCMLFAIIIILKKRREEKKGDRKIY
jgi:hypothetical protein